MTNPQPIGNSMPSTKLRFASPRSAIQSVEAELRTRNRAASFVTCGLRKEGPRKTLWRSRVLSAESIQAIHSLKFAKSDSSKLDHVFRSRLSRLLKADLLDALAELQRQNELYLAFKVFNYVRGEIWYEPDLSMYCDMIRVFDKNKSTEMMEQLFCSLLKEGLKPNTRAFTEVIGTYFHVGMAEKALETYAKMKASGCLPDKLTFMILIRNLEKAGEEELAASLKKECALYIEDYKKFLKELGHQMPKTRSSLAIAQIQV